MKKIHLVYVWAAAFAVGCNPPAAKTPEVATSTAGTAEKPAEPAGASTAGTTSGAPTTPTTPPSNAPAIADLPANLKHKGFDYFGLANEKPMNMQVTATGRSEITTGTQTVQLMELRDGKATFQVTRTGRLEELLGTDTVSLEPDGVYITASSKNYHGHDKELPADPQPGTTWDYRLKMNNSTQNLDVYNKFKVEGIGKVTTKLGSYNNALHVVTTGDGTVQGTKVKIKADYWYVPGRGGVKYTMVVTPATGKPDTIVVQETN